MYKYDSLLRMTAKIIKIDMPYCNLYSSC